MHNVNVTNVLTYLQEYQPSGESPIEDVMPGDNGIS